MSGVEASGESQPAKKTREVTLCQGYLHSPPERSLPLPGVLHHARGYSVRQLFANAAIAANRRRGGQKRLLVIVVTNCTGDHVLRVNGTVICCEGRVKSSALGVWIICS